MYYIVHKIDLDGLELLPDITDTVLWNFLDPDRITTPTKSEKQIAMLYEAIRRRENYYQENTPTAFGNPDYELYCGIVIGILQALEAEEEKTADQIIIKKNNRKMLVIEKLNRPKAYFESIKDNRESLKAFGL